MRSIAIYLCIGLCAYQYKLAKRPFNFSSGLSTVLYVTYKEMHRSENNENRDVVYPEISSTKVCHIVKRSDFEGYGFNLHSERIKPGQYVGKVDVNSPAEVSGLKEGYRIIEVNGVNISQESHKHVVQRIKAISNEVRLLIVDDKSIKELAAEKSSPLPKSINEKINSKELEVEKQRSNASSGDMIMRKPVTNYDANTTQKHDYNNKDEQNNATTAYNFHEMHLEKDDETRPQLCIKGSNTASSGGLELPMTAAEMRAKLLSKKKYDPKNEIVDLKKKFEIIQKL
ncbi:Na(+)/H(+) exchange regulatory cofactor NHE-RF1 isoform X2 [Bactrocera dorsalis]|uniref:Na(+)/H(+) exchange regulatory cofactor NHE-RF1 isoform X2 n=1 Tax=Bactrocera dorsalis TaxID=27457 RepID=A0A6J0RIV5_BACDO|nr:Na(+)/H(+) exchange regulatory cofactor NHE-RF1 isoform X2 [Bactrocera dorsalis]